MVTMNSGLCGRGTFYLMLYYYYSFPKNEEVRQKWISSLNIKQTITANSVICSRHFNPSSFYTTDSRTLLKANAIPTILPRVRIFYYGNFTGLLCFLGFRVTKEKKTINKIKQNKNNNNITVINNFM